MDRASATVAPVALVRDARSEPARSTRARVAGKRQAGRDTRTTSTACDRDDTWLASVAAVARAAMARAMRRARAAPSGAARVAAPASAAPPRPTATLSEPPSKQRTLSRWISTAVSDRDASGGIAAASAAAARGATPGSTGVPSIVCVLPEPV